MIDGECLDNFVDQRVVDKLGLETRPHPSPYELHWLHEEKKVLVHRQVDLPFSIGRYTDIVRCDVVSMEVSHLVFARPWKVYKEAVQHEGTNSYSFRHLGKKIKLVPQTPKEVATDQKIMRDKREQERKDLEEALKMQELEEVEEAQIEDVIREINKQQEMDTEILEEKQILLSEPSKSLTSLGDVVKKVSEFHFIFRPTSFVLQETKVLEEFLNSRTNSFKEGGIDAIHGTPSRDYIFYIWKRHPRCKMDLELSHNLGEPTLYFRLDPKYCLFISVYLFLFCVK